MASQDNQPRQLSETDIKKILTNVGLRGIVEGQERGDQETIDRGIQLAAENIDDETMNALLRSVAEADPDGPRSPSGARVVDRPRRGTDSRPLPRRP